MLYRSSGEKYSAGIISSMPRLSQLAQLTDSSHVIMRGSDAKSHLRRVNQNGPLPLYRIRCRVAGLRRYWPSMLRAVTTVILADLTLPPDSAEIDNSRKAVCQCSRANCFSGRARMWLAASRNVISVLSSRTIGWSNLRDQRLKVLSCSLRANRGDRKQSGPSVGDRWSRSGETSIPWEGGSLDAPTKISPKGSA